MLATNPIVVSHTERVTEGQDLLVPGSYAWEGSRLEVGSRLETFPSQWARYNDDSMGEEHKGSIQEGQT